MFTCVIYTLSWDPESGWKYCAYAVFKWLLPMWFIRCSGQEEEDVWKSPYEAVLLLPSWLEEKAAKQSAVIQSNAVIVVSSFSRWSSHSQGSLTWLSCLLSSLITHVKNIDSKTEKLAFLYKLLLMNKCEMYSDCWECWLRINSLVHQYLFITPTLVEVVSSLDSAVSMQQNTYQPCLKCVATLACEVQKSKLSKFMMQLIESTFIVNKISNKTSVCKCCEISLVVDIRHSVIWVVDDALSQTSIRRCFSSLTSLTSFISV